MKTLCLIAGALVCSIASFAQYGYYTPPRPRATYTAPSYAPPVSSYNTQPSVQYNSGYVKQNGTVVDPYYSTKPDNTNWNNFGSQGNTNPYTGQQGSRAKDYTPEATNYGQGRTIYEGPRGGQYYINGSGNKVYVPKRNSPY